jgi:hypothetical protein
MTQRPVLHAAEREPRLASDAAMDERFYDADPVDRLAPHCDGPLPRPRPLRGAGGGPRPRAPSTARSRLPASSTARRACLPGRARSLLGRNRQPGCWAPFPRARPGARARASSSRAFADLPSLSAANAATGPRAAPPGRDFESNRSLNLTRAASLVPRRARFAARSFSRGRGRLTRRTDPTECHPRDTSAYPRGSDGVCIRDRRYGQESGPDKDLDRPAGRRSPCTRGHPPEATDGGNGARDGCLQPVYGPDRRAACTALQRVCARSPRLREELQALAAPRRVPAG